MPFAVSQYQQPGVANIDATLFALEDGTGNRADVWPALGFNCIRWQAPWRGATWDLLYTDPQLFANGRPTRSGIPVLFPFPNRVRDARFTWDGKQYDLPKTDATGKHSIHGFACRRPWRVVGHGADASSAWITGEFHCSKDDPASRPCWPADHLLRLTIRLARGSLRLEAEVTNPDRVPLPFGLGFHQYFRVPPTAAGRGDDWHVRVPAAEFWELAESLPTGVRGPVDPTRDLTQPRPFSELRLDDVLTGLTAAADGNGLRDNGALRDTDGATLSMASSPTFRELVVFTPQHREAFCIEPYTCTTDAINLQARGIDAGLIVLPPGGKWTGVVEMRLHDRAAS